MSFYKMFNILNIEIYTFIGGIGVKGSFEGLYTFLEVAEIYGIDDSCLRKQVARNKFVIGEEVKKMGRTWIITEQAMIKSFGTLKFEEYKKKQQKREQIKEKKLRILSFSLLKLISICQFSYKLYCPSALSYQCRIILYRYNIL